MSIEERLAAAEACIRELGQRLALQEDLQAIRRLHFAYGYFMDRCLFAEIVDLFSDDAVLHFKGGVFRGKDGARRLYGGAPGRGGPEYGLLLEHLMAQDVIHVAADRRTARGRFRCYLQGGVHASVSDPPPVRPLQFHEGGIYENEYLRQDGVWKISVFNYNVVYRCSYEEGWRRAPLPPVDFLRHERTYPDNPLGPDELEAPMPRWPEPVLVPFHFSHPVTGKPISYP